MKVTCANPECGHTIHTLAVKMGMPGSGEKKDGKWFCSHTCYSNYQADLLIEDKRCGLKKSVRRIKLGMLLLKNYFINKEQLSMALEAKGNSSKRLGEILVENGYITEKELKAVLSMQAGVAPIILDANLKVKLKEEIPFKLINEFHFLVFDFDLESKTILVAIYDMDYISCLEEYFAKIYPGYLVKFYLEDKGKILTILANNFPGKPLHLEIQNRNKTFEKEPGSLDKKLNKIVDLFMTFLGDFTGSDVQIDNLDNAVWLKGETKDYKVDIYLTKKV